MLFWFGALNHAVTYNMEKMGIHCNFSRSTSVNFSVSTKRVIIIFETVVLYVKNVHFQFTRVILVKLECKFASNSGSISESNEAKTVVNKSLLVLIYQYQTCNENDRSDLCLAVGNTATDKL